MAGQGRGRVCAIIAACFVSNWTIGLMTSSLPFIYEELLTRFGQSATITSGPFSLYHALGSLLAPLARKVIGWTSLRAAGMIGGLVLSAGIAISAFAKHIGLVYFSYIIAGIGYSLGFLTVVTVPPLHFAEKKFLVLSIVVVGFQIGNLTGPYIMVTIMARLSYQNVCLVLASLTFPMCLSGIFYYPVPTERTTSSETHEKHIGLDDKHSSTEMEPVLPRKESNQETCKDTRSEKEVEKSTHRDSYEEEDEDNVRSVLLKDAEISQNPALEDEVEKMAGEQSFKEIDEVHGKLVEDSKDCMNIKSMHEADIPHEYPTETTGGVNIGNIGNTKLLENSEISVNIITSSGTEINVLQPSKPTSETPVGSGVDKEKPSSSYCCGNLPGCKNALRNTPFRGSKNHNNHGNCHHDNHGEKKHDQGNCHHDNHGVKEHDKGNCHHDNHGIKVSGSRSSRWKKMFACDELSMIFNPTFLTIVFALIGGSIGQSVFKTFIVVLFDEKGISKPESALLLLISAVSSIVASPLFGILYTKQRVKPYVKHLYAAGWVGVGVVSALFAVAGSKETFIPMFILFGIFLASVAGQLTGIMSDIFGQEHVLTYTAAARVFQGLASFAGPYIVGVLKDNIGSYSIGFTIGGSFGATSGLCLLSLLVYKHHRIPQHTLEAPPAYTNTTEKHDKEYKLIAQTA